MSLTSTPYADLSNGRILVRVGEATAVLTRRTEDGGDGRLPKILGGYRITCEALTDIDESPWFVEIPTDLDLRAALRIAEVVANRADEHLGRTRRFREDALAKIDDAIHTETDVDEDADAPHDHTRHLETDR